MKTTVEMTAEQKAKYDAFLQNEEIEKAKQQAKEDRMAYATMVDEQVINSIGLLQELSKNITQVKVSVLDGFNDILSMKADVLGKTKDGQKSHTFTHSNGQSRVTIGRHTTDGWKDTVEDGVAIVKDACLSLIKDDVTKALVDQMMRLLSRDREGSLKANKALQLRKLANDLNNSRLNEGIEIIEEAYIPTLSKSFIYAEYKDKKTNAWVSVPLGMTEA